MSSAIVAVCGSSSLIHVRSSHTVANSNIGATQGNDFCPLVIPVIRWPLPDRARELGPVDLRQRLLVIEHVDVRRRRPT